MKEQAIVLTSTIVLPGNLTLEILGLFALLLILSIVLLVFVLKQKKEIADLDRRLRKLTRGKNSLSLETEIIHLFEANDVLTEDGADLKKKMARQQKMLDTCFRKMGMIRYDAFQQMGGKLSFALALLNEEENGLILNSVHSPDGNYTYIKEVHDGKCEMDVGVEEQQALDRALAQE
ncbi:MAG: DUF4446 family protein [Lachnospiraceae bacterium]|nr:DUF4446 family protein [Lachnospiraceae bacterium]